MQAVGMDGHQRQVWERMVEFHDDSLIDAFWSHEAPIDMELELRTARWAPATPRTTMTSTERSKHSEHGRSTLSPRPSTSEPDRAPDLPRRALRGDAGPPLVSNPHRQLWPASALRHSSTHAA
jgi:hypothetical protein